MQFTSEIAEYNNANLPFTRTKAVKMWVITLSTTELIK